MVYQTDWSANAESSLHSYNISHLIMVYDPFNVLLNLVCWYSVEEFCIYIHQGYWLVIFFSCGFLVWFWYQGHAGLVKMSFEEFPSLLFWGKFQNNRYQLFFWIFGGIHQWSLWSWLLECFACWNVFDYWFNLLIINQSSYFLFHLDSVFVGSTFLET